MIPRTILAKLASLRRRERLLALAWGAAQWLALVAAALGTACLGDWLIDRERDTPWAVRRLLLAAQVLLAATAGFFFLVKPQMRRLRNDTLALWVEERQPALEHRLITAVQLGRPGARSEGMSHELIAVVTREAEAQSALLDFACVADHCRLRRAALTLAPVVLLIALAAVLAPNLAGVLLARQLQADIDIPHSVAIEPLKLEEVRPAGEKVVLQFRVRSAELDPAWLGAVFVTPVGQPRDRYPLEFDRKDGGDAIFQATLPPSAANLTYTARLRDGRMRRPGQITLVPRPIVTEQYAWLQLPDFCGKRPDGSRYEQPQGRGDIVGIPGSSARIVIKTQKPVRRAFLQIFGPRTLARSGDQATDLSGKNDEPAAEIFQREVGLELAADGTTADGIFDMQPTESAYRIVTLDEYGFDNVPA